MAATAALNSIPWFTSWTNKAPSRSGMRSIPRTPPPTASAALRLSSSISGVTIWGSQTAPRAAFVIHEADTRRTADVTRSPTTWLRMS